VLNKKLNKKGYLTMKRIKKYLGIACIGLAGCSIGYASYLILSLMQKRSTIIEHAHLKAQKKASFTAEELGSFISPLKTVAQEMKATLQKNPASSLKELIPQDSNELFGTGIAYKGPNGNLSASYLVEVDGQLKIKTLDGSQTNQSATIPWYQVVQDKGEGFYGPFSDPATKEEILIYALPISTPQFNKGIIFTTQSLNHLKYILSSFYLGQSGYWFMLNKEGTILFHPTNELVANKKTIKDLAHKTGSKEMLKKFETAEKSGSSEMSYSNEITQNDSWVFFNKLASSPFILAGVFDKEASAPIDFNYRRSTLITIALAIAFALIFLILLILLISTITKSNLWLWSIFTSITLATTLSAVWFFVNLYPPYKINEGQIKDKATMYTILDSFKKHKKSDKHEQEASRLFKWLTFKKQANALYIPTGLLINDLNIVSENQIEIVGFIWQRYHNSIHKNVRQGFLFPQVADTPDIQEINRTTLNGTTNIIWQVRTKLNQNMTFTKFPFDVKDLEIHLWHKDFHKHVLLIPDLDSYKILNPAALPAINPEAYLTGWHLISSYFGYKQTDYQTNFGLYEYSPFGRYKEVKKFQSPELYFNISAQRSLVDTFSTDFLALMVILILLFIICLVFHKLEFGWLLGSCATILFSTLIAQLRLVGKFPSAQFVYFESFYFVVYIALLIILGVLVLHFLDKEPRWLSYKESIIPKILYWPSILTAILGITLWYLY
jgi:hypothetical protein